jgi:hypothetical protein
MAVLARLEDTTGGIWVSETERGYTITEELTSGDTFRRYLQGILNAHHGTAYPLMDVPASQRFAVPVLDERGLTVGGAPV